jgi:hypothetical protein
MRPDRILILPAFKMEPVSGYAPDYAIYRTALAHFRVLAKLVPAEGVAPSLAAF